jgi:glucose-6-phosphate isomerase
MIYSNTNHMLPTINPTTTSAWAALEQHYREIGNKHLREFFKEDPNRFAAFSRQQGDVLVDFSKNRINQTTWKLLIDLARECQVPAAIKAMFNGELINQTGPPQFLR